LCTVFNILARQGELQKLSIHTVWPCFNRSSTSFRTMAVVFLVSATIKGEVSFVSLPAYIRLNHKYPVIASHSS
jgi:hypothetical protein